MNLLALTLAFSSCELYSLPLVRPSYPIHKFSILLMVYDGTRCIMNKSKTFEIYV